MYENYKESFGATAGGSNAVWICTGGEGCDGG